MHGIMGSCEGQIGQKRLAVAPVLPNRIDQKIGEAARGIEIPKTPHNNTRIAMSDSLYDCNIAFPL